MTSVYDFTLKTLDGHDLALGDLRGKAILFVNVASQCGYTPQYAGLEALYREARDQGLVVVGVPSNDFGAQEPGTDAEIKTFCSTKFNVDFPVASKLVVKGDTKHPLYEYLTTVASPPGEVQWNFEKFLVDRQGQVVGRFRSGVTPESRELRDAIAGALGSAS